MSKLKVFCFGYGQVAERFLNKLIQENKDFDFNITSRQKTHKLLFENKLKINSYKFEDNNFDDSLINKLEDSNYILISIPPINGLDIVLKNFESSFKKIKNCKWITYLSATSVYGDHKGNWVTEESKVLPSSTNGVYRLNAENQWKDFSNKNNLPLQIFRLAGIYSEDQNILRRLKMGKVKIVDKKNHFFSRIHVEDIASVLLKSLKSFKDKETYNICDDMPASQKDVAIYGSKLLGLTEPEYIKLEEVESEMLRNFYKDSKKVDNKKMKAFFNYTLKYPTYVEGLDHILNDIS